jgi:hypothetical protein
MCGAALPDRPMHGPTGTRPLAHGPGRVAGSNANSRSAEASEPRGRRNELKWAREDAREDGVEAVGTAKRAGESGRMGKGKVPSGDGDDGPARRHAGNASRGYDRASRGAVAAARSPAQESCMFETASGGVYGPPLERDVELGLSFCRVRMPTHDAQLLAFLRRQLWGLLDRHIADPRLPLTAAEKRLLHVTRDVLMAEDACLRFRRERKLARKKHEGSSAPKAALNRGASSSVNPGGGKYPSSPISAPRGSTTHTSREGTQGLVRKEKKTPGSDHSRAHHHPPSTEQPRGSKKFRGGGSEKNPTPLGAARERPGNEGRGYKYLYLYPRL